MKKCPECEDVSTIVSQSGQFVCESCLNNLFLSFNHSGTILVRKCIGLDNKQLF